MPCQYNGTFVMPHNYRNIGDSINWSIDPRGGLREEDGDSERPIGKNSLIAELAKRAFIKRGKSAKESQFKACELLALLPACPKTTKTVDEIVLEGMSVIELWDS
jgi:hypothetical protein